MAALVVQSRFAGLQIEDDDYPSSVESQKSKKNKPNPAKKPAELPKKKNASKPQQPQSATKKKKQKAPASTAEQWEQWKQKDEELVDGNYETELQQAILLSKLDYEEKKDVYKQMKKEAELEKKNSEIQTQAKNSKKQKKKNVMSLDQFNDMVSGEDAKHNQTEAEKSTEEQKSPSRDTEFFERVKDEAKNELLKDKIIDRVRGRKNASDEVISRAHFLAALEKKEKEIADLKVEVTGLKEELLTVKSRNKKLCAILGQGEMKDKAEVLMEVERLRNVQAELTAEIADLHSHLEKERSRNEPRNKDKKKKSGDKDK